MKSRLTILLSGLFIAIFLLSSSLPLLHSNSQTSGPFIPGSATVQVDCYVPASFSLFDISAHDTANATINIHSLNLTAPEQIRIVSSFRAEEFSAYAILRNGSTVTLTAVVISATSSAFVGYYLTLPTFTQDVTITASGGFHGESILYRFIAPVPVLLLQDINIPITYSSTIVTTSHSTLSQVYYKEGIFRPRVPYQINGVEANGFKTYQLPSNAEYGVVQSTSFYADSIAVSIITLVVAVLAGITLVESNRRVFATKLQRLSSISNGARQFSRAMPRFIKVYFGKISSDPSKRVSWRTFLTLFILCGILMISIGVLAGPSPQIKAYVVADPSIVPLIQNNLNSAIGSTQVITPSQDYSDFAVMSSVGFFNVVVVSNYPTLALPEISGFVLPNLANVPVIIVDKQANQSFVSEIKALYGNRVITVGNAANLNSTEVREVTQQIKCCGENRPNPLGITLSTNGFKEAVVAEAGLSMVIVLLGGAVIGYRASEPDNDKTMFRFGTFVLIGVFVFFYSETIYVVTSSLLTFPLSLHAVISGSTSITGVGLLGRVLHLPFGGGSTPRSLAMVVGFLFGALYSGWRIRFSVRVLVLLGALVVFLISIPVEIGTFTFQATAYFFGNTGLGSFFTGSYTIKDYLYGIGNVLAGDVSPQYLLSAGKMIFFAALVPLAFLNRMRKNTASITLLVCTVMLWEGGRRIGEMTPTKTTIAVLPGLLAGFSFTLILLLIAALENYLSRSVAK